MADIGLTPPRGKNRGSFTGTLTATGGKFGSVVVESGTGNHADVKPCTSAGEVGIQGVIQSQGDPNNSGGYAIGENADVRDEGEAWVLFGAGAVLDIGDTIIASATTGLAKKLGAESAPYDVLGYCRQKITIGAAPGHATVKLHIHRVEA